MKGFNLAQQAAAAAKGVPPGTVGGVVPGRVGVVVPAPTTPGSVGMCQEFVIAETVRLLIKP